MTKHDIEQERAKFEAFASKHGMCVTKYSDLYLSHTINWMWRAWQAAIKADRQQRGEPVGYIGKYEMESLTRNGVSVTVYPSESIETIPVYTAPQPAAPTQEPSDGEGQS